MRRPGVCLKKTVFNVFYNFPFYLIRRRKSYTGLSLSYTVFHHFTISLFSDLKMTEPKIGSHISHFISLKFLSK